MKADELLLEELIRFEPGRIHLHERRLVVHDVNALAHLRKDIVEMLGMDHARRLFTRFGYFWGTADAAAMKRIFDWDDPVEWMKACSRMLAIQGIVRPVVKEMTMDRDAGVFEAEVTWHQSGEAEEHRIAFGDAEAPTCWSLVGYASGYASFVMDRKIFFVEKRCRGTGDRLCVAVGKTEEAWGEELEGHLEYFESGEVRTTIVKLSEELKRKTEQLARQRSQLERLQGAKAPFVEVHSRSFRRVIEMAARVAPFDSSVLITGESGTGKEVLARYVHNQSERKGRPFVAANCGALPETLLESELFGHKSGAFTGAHSDRAGLFEQAGGGTIFLDEIAETGPALQVKLLRVLQEGEYMRVGESVTRKADVRVIAATNRNISKEVDEGRFRDDLYYRLGVIEIAIPPLRERPEDILPLARHFTQALARKLKKPNLALDATCLDFLQNHRWPGNVRELENAIERAAVLCRDDVIMPEFLPPAILRAESGRAHLPPQPLRSLEQVEFEHIRTVLEHVGGNKTRAAETLGISQATLWRKLKKIDGQGGGR